MKNFSQIINDLILFSKSDYYRRIINSENVIIFGAGNQGNLAIKCLEQMGVKVKAFCDNDNNKHGKVFSGVSCISPSELKEINNCIVLVTGYSSGLEIRKQLDSMKIDNLTFDMFAYSHSVDEIFKLYKSLEDNKSKETMEAILSARIEGDCELVYSVFTKNKYFCIPDISNISSKEVFVDCGAFVGDTLEKYIFDRRGKFGKYYAFEPGPSQFKALEKRKNRLDREWALNSDQIVCVNGGVGSENTKLRLEITSAILPGAQLVEGFDVSTDEVQIYSLDNYFGFDEISFLTADVEGFEMQMLKGAEKTISYYKPNIAIAIYHKTEDLYIIASYLKQLVPEYKFAMRHHAKNISETFIYCWI